jgi:hypothetical protein
MQFQSRWARTPSAQLQKNIRDTLIKHLKMLEVAQNSDGTVRKRFEEQIAYIEALSASKVRLYKTDARDKHSKI